MGTVADLRAPEPAPAGRLASWYTPGRTDGFGDRLLMFDHGETEGLELLRFQPALAAAVGFEPALRRSVERLAPLTSPAFARIRAVDRLEADGALALVSIHTTGRPLSELLDRRARRGVDPALVTWTLREASAALTWLHAVGSDVAHGALTADRIVVMPDGRVRILEHALGAALATLNLTPAQAWSRFGLAVPVQDIVARFDARTDVFQLGVVALSLLLGRRLGFADVPALPKLVAEWSDTATRRGVDVQGLRRWLETALQIVPATRTHAIYATGAHAYQGLRQVPAPPESSGLGLLQSIASAGPPLVDPSSPAQSSPRSDDSGHAAGTERSALPPGRARQSGWTSVPVWMAVALAAIAVGEAAMGIVIWRTAADIGSATVLAAAADADAMPSATGGAARGRGDIELPKPRRPFPPRSGGIRLVAPIELQVLEGDRVLGSSTGGAIVASPGTHDLELVNSSLGVRVHRVVTFRSGQVTNIPIELPLGRISIDAEPGSEVLIDDRSVGETPLANVEIAIGPHEVVIRHPQLGERRETLVVRADADALVHVEFEP